MNNEITTPPQTKPTIVLKDGQESAVQAMLAWIQRPYNKDNLDDLYFTLTGSAGTGKSTTLDQFIKRCPEKVRHNLCVTAPTHKAKKVVANITGLTAATIQSLLGLRPNTDIENFDHNKPQFDPLNDSTMSNYTAIIIDECSMVNSDLFDLLLKESQSSKVKILFVGDLLQLPPIGEVSSRSLIEVKNRAELVEVVRQQNTNPLAILLKALRDDILNETETFFNIIKQESKNVNTKMEGYACCTKEEFSQQMITHFKDYRFTNNKDFVKYTAWQNNSIKSANNYIRKKINNSNDIIASGDLLMSYSSISLQGKKGEAPKTILVNSEDYLVTGVTRDRDANKIEGFQVTLYREDVAPWDRVVHVFVVDTNNNYNTFASMHNQLLDKAKLYGKSAWVSYFKFKNQYILLSEMRDGNNKLLSTKDLDYGYGITVHKTQGSTYDNIFVNLIDIKQVAVYGKYSKESIRLMKQLIYVALSRAKHCAYILIE
jgi:ATP-dependent exoDNAse (exonuclease V) alpha subunit